MPKPYKILISVLALVAGATVFYFDSDGGAARWIALALGPMMVFGIWIFPEPKVKEIRKEAAERR